jgi:3-oxoacyl-(acyl-carrier-protein) synthase
VFPETVFNAPSSHLAALLGSTGINYTIVGDPGTFAQGLAVAGDWLLSGMVDACVVVGAEENDWLTADAFRLFCKQMALSDGAGALYLKTAPSQVRLDTISDACLFMQNQSRLRAAQRVRAQLPETEGTLLCDGLQGLRRMDLDEERAWADWNGDRVSIKRVVGEGLTAGAAWQCVVAVDAIRNGRRAANVPIIGANQQAVGVRFVAQW